MDSAIQNLPSLLTSNQIAVVLNVPIKTIYHWVLRREIPYTKIGRHLRFNMTEVLTFFKEKTVEKSCSSLAALVESRHRSLKTRGNFVAGHRSLQCP